MKPRVLVIGLDCAAPELVFDRFADDLPTLTALRERGAWGPLRSCHPPITVPAWSVMLSGRDPGELGIYGFRNRKDRSYDRLSIATSLDVKVPRIWDHLTRPDDYSIVVGVPGTWPPPAIRGDLVSGFLAPGTGSDTRWTHPPELAREIEGVTADYQVDVRDFRTGEKDRLIAEICEMTRKRFTLLRHLLTTRPWNFSVLVEIGLDRIHHGFWRHLDPDHRLHEPDSPYKEVIRDYYRLLDAEIAETLDSIGFGTGTSGDPGNDDLLSGPESGSAIHPAHGDTTVFIVSDHGARSLEGGFALNDWLIRGKYLVLHEEHVGPKEPLPPGSSSPASGDRDDSAPDRIILSPDMIDWSRTRAWGEGGYYGRVFLNVKGREPEGIVPRSGIESLLSELTRKLENLPDDHGAPMGTVVRRPEELFSEINGIPPDLFVYFGNLAWRSIGTISPPPASGTPAVPDRSGAASLYTPGNDTGPDDANHDWEGIFIAAGRASTEWGGTAGIGQKTARDIHDIASRILKALNRSP